MRSAQRDQGNITECGAQVSDAAGGNGVAQPGSIPFTFTRTGSGAYQINLDPRLIVLSGVAGGNDTAITFANLAPTAAPAGCRVVLRSDAGTLTNSGFNFTVRAKDTRL